MAFKTNEIKKMTKQEREKKLKELEFELIKSRVEGSKTGNQKTRGVKKMIAQLLTLNK